MTWPDECMRSHGGRSHWRDWLPEKGMEGQVSGFLFIFYTIGNLKEIDKNKNTNYMNKLMK